MSTLLPDLHAAVAAIWRAVGETPPVGEEREAAALLFLDAIETGRRIPRTSDKTVQPLSGPRRDIDAARPERERAAPRDPTRRDS